MKWIFVVCLLGECACVRYTPATLDPVQSEAQLRRRGLDDAGLRDFVRQRSGDAGLEWPPRKLNAGLLADIALYFSSDLDVARAHASAASAAVITARRRLYPSVSAEGGYNKTAESVATYSLSPTFTIETAGKRSYRIMEAEKLEQASRIALEETEWQVRRRLDAALANYHFAQRKLSAIRAEETLRGEIAGIFEARLQAGEAAQPELSAARADQAGIAVNIRGAEGEVAYTLAALAAAAGLPVQVLESHSIDTSFLDAPPEPGAIPVIAIERTGLLHRADIRRLLTEYAATDAHLRLEIANQYPNIPLNPAYTFQEGFPAYTLGSAFEFLPAAHRNRGPIAEAEAARNESAARFKALQAQVIAEAESALRRYRAAFEQWRTARDSVEAVARERERQVNAGLRAGENDRLEYVQSRLMTLAASRAGVDALARTQTALGDLENAVQSPLNTRPENTH